MHEMKPFIDNLTSSSQRSQMRLISKATFSPITFVTTINFKSTFFQFWLNLIKWMNQLQFVRVSVLFRFVSITVVLCNCWRAFGRSCVDTHTHSASSLYCKCSSLSALVRASRSIVVKCHSHIGKRMSCRPKRYRSQLKYVMETSLSSNCKMSWLESVTLCVLTCVHTLAYVVHIKISLFH